MTDLEMTRLCAKAMGYTLTEMDTPRGKLPLLMEGNVLIGSTYDPLHDDARAMVLVKKFQILIGTDDEHWTAFIPKVGRSIHNHDLNQAIVECVAKMQLEKEKTK